MAAALDSAQWFTLLVWLAILLVFLSSLAAVFLSSRSVRVHFRLAWIRQLSSSHATLKPLLLAVSVAIVDAFLLQISAGETWAMRLALVLVGAGVTFVSFHWGWKQVSMWIDQRSGQTREWSLRSESARRELQGLFEPTALRHKACQLLRHNLKVRHASLFMLESDAYRRVTVLPQQADGEVEFPIDSLLQQELASGWSFRSLTLVDGRNGTPLRWSGSTDGDLAGEQSRLAVLSAQVAVPMQSQLKLDGFFLLGPRAHRAAFCAHHLEFAEAIARQLVDSLHIAALTQPDLIVAEQAHQRATWLTARVTRSHLSPPQRGEIPGVEYGVDYWLGDQPGGIYYDIIGLPEGMAAFVLADIPGPIEAATVRLVQFQALLRSRAWAHGEDLAEWVESTARGLSHSLTNHPPISFFCARPIRDGRRMQYLNAGHYPGIILRRTAAGAEVTRLHIGGPAIGENLNTRYEVGEIELNEGEFVAIPSLGVVNALNSESETWRENGLAESLLGWESRPVKETVQQALQAVDAFTGNDPNQPPRFLIALRPTSGKHDPNA